MRAVATLAQASGRAARGGEASELAVLVGGVDDPVDAGVAADGLVLGVDEDDLVVLVRRVLVDPVGVQHAQASQLAAGTLLSLGLEVAHPLELVDPLVLGLPVDDALGVGTLTPTSSDGHAVDDEALLGLVAEAMSLVRARGAVHLVDLGQLAVLPRPHTQQEAEQVRLLLPPELLQELVSPHRSCGAVVMVV